VRCIIIHAQACLIRFQAPRCALVMRTLLPTAGWTCRKAKRMSYYILILCSCIHRILRYDNMDMAFAGALRDVTTPVQIAYDISCQYSQNFWRRFSQLPDGFRPTFQPNKTSFIVGAFHITGHIEQCQLRFAGDYLPGNGTTPGDNVEHGWAWMNTYAASFSKMLLGACMDAINQAVGQFNFEKLVWLGMCLDTACFAFLMACHRASSKAVSTLCRVKGHVSQGCS
jgi:hypothetical protein